MGSSKVKALPQWSTHRCILVIDKEKFHKNKRTFSLQSLVATQQVINQTSAIIKHQQKLLSASGDPATTTSPPSSSKHTSSLTHSHARQKLVFHAATSTASTPMQANGPLTQELAMGGASTPATPLQNSVAPTASAVEMSPQMTGLESTTHTHTHRVKVILKAMESELYWLLDAHHAQ